LNLIIGVIAVSFAAVLIRLADAPPLVIAAYRLCLASLILAPLVSMRSWQEIRRLQRKDLILAMVSGAFLALHFFLWITSLSYTSVATSVVLVTITPIFVAVASYLLFRERLTRQVIAGIVVCLVGAVLIGYGNWQIGTESLYGGVLALLGALAVAGYLIIGRRLRQEISLLSYAFLVYGSAAVILMVAVFISDYPIFDYSGDTYVMLVLLAVVPQLIGHMSLVWALRFVSATLVTVAILGEPIGATILAFVILDEIPTWSEIVGGVLILAGIFVAFRRSRTAAIER
jgi:drug/metabolite transporter (DMT)-like permease